MMNLDNISHISAAEKGALPAIDDAPVATKLNALLGFDLGAYRPDLDIGIECFSVLVEAFPTYADSLPPPWRDVTYRWIEGWIAPGVPPDESRPVFAALEACRALLRRDEATLASALRLLAHLPTEKAAPAMAPATEAQLEQAEGLVRQFCAERGDNAFSQKSLLVLASQIRALPSAAVAPHVPAFLEAGRCLWDGQRIYEINEAILDILDAAPSAEALAEALRPCGETPYTVVHGPSIPVDVESRRDSDEAPPARVQLLEQTTGGRPSPCARSTRRVPAELHQPRWRLLFVVVPEPSRNRHLLTRAQRVAQLVG